VPTWQSIFGIHGSELDGTRGDKGELLSYISREHSLSPDECMMIGDREYDVLGALSASMRSIGVLRGYDSREELQSAGSTALVSSPKDIFNLESLF
jgi:phosphoglycolate phosphatase